MEQACKLLPGNTGKSQKSPVPCKADANRAAEGGQKVKTLVSAGRKEAITDCERTQRRNGGITKKKRLLDVGHNAYNKLARFWASACSRSSR